MTIRLLEDRASWWRESGAVIRLAVPLTLTHLAHMMIMLTDVVMMGRIGTETLAAGSLARDFYWVMMAFAIGVLTGATPVMAQHLGARRFRAIRPAARNAAWLCVPLAILVMITAWHTSPILVALGQDPAISTMSEAYLRAMIWGLLPYLWFVVLSEFLAAHVRPRSILVVTVHAHRAQRSARLCPHVRQARCARTGSGWRRSRQRHRQLGHVRRTPRLRSRRPPPSPLSPAGLLLAAGPHRDGRDRASGRTDRGHGNRRDGSLFCHDSHDGRDLDRDTCGPRGDGPGAMPSSS